ncbi:MAG: FtsW/RodA/SpoVE family cell cycle protein [Faecousia sp.]
MTLQSILDGIMQFFSQLGQLMEPVVQWLEDGLAGIPVSFSQMDGTYGNFYISMVRYACPILAALLLLRCAMPLLTFRREPEIWAWLVMPGGERVPVTHWENVIGRSKSCDVSIALSTVSRNHAVLTRYDDGSWTISDAHSKDGTYVNGERVNICALQDGDVISVGGVKLKLKVITKQQEQLQSQLRTRASGPIAGFFNLLLLTVFQVMIMMGFAVHNAVENSVLVLEGFGGIILAQWLLYVFYLFIRRSSFEMETLAFFLCTLGMAAIATVAPKEALKQLIAMLAGVLVYLLVGASLRNLERAKRVRYLAVAAGLGFLLLTLAFGTEYYGAKNWIIVGGISLQPSELSKVCFVFAGASTMDRIMNKRNLIAFIVYSVLICACLAVMNDFGTALIFFCSFLIIAYLRSGSMGTVALAITALVLAGILALRVAPHALDRFATWRHIWEDPFNKGYQQTQSLMCIASGGLFGVGAGKGWLRKVFAADSDIVFATISEEWGLLLAMMAVLCICAFGFFAIRTARVARSSFYSIGACTAAGILLIQTILNTLGTVDILPFTGVTFPFVSNGGTSMVASWGLLAFVKAADTRQNASFAVKLSRKVRKK